MSCCKADSLGDPAERKVSQAIDKELQEYKQEMKKEIKLLLLGAGDSGKSTLAKQIRMLYVTGFDDNERLGFRPIVYTNVCLGMKSLLSHVEGPWTTKELKRAAKAIETIEFVFPESDPLQEEIGPYLETLWRSSTVQEVFSRRHELNLAPSLDHFMSRIRELSKESYLPSDQDILFSRQRTRGIVETVYQQDRTQFRLVDVGGQRNERSKWIHCFEGVGAIIFVAAVSEYNQFLEEDPSVNRLDEALALFKGIVSYQWFLDTAVILFLNKTDLLREKVHQVPLSDYYPKFKWPPKPKGSSVGSSGDLEREVSSSGGQTGSSSTTAGSSGVNSSGKERKAKSKPSSKGTQDPESGGTSTTRVHKPKDLEKHAMKFIEKMFMKRLPKGKDGKPSTRVVFPHFTQATDSNQTRIVFEAVRRNLLNQSLELGFS